MIWGSLILVFGILAGVAVSLTSVSSELLPGAGQIIHGRVPWLLLGGLWGGVALGVASLFRGRKLPKLAVLLVQIPAVTYVTWYVLVGSALPAHSLAIDVGEPFPAYALQDHDGTLHEMASLEPRKPAIYIFYRGGW